MKATVRKRMIGRAYEVEARDGQPPKQAIPVQNTKHSFPGHHQRTCADDAHPQSQIQPDKPIHQRGLQRKTSQLKKAFMKGMTANG